MQVICTDGTVLQCDRFEAIDSGVLLFEERRQSGAGEGEDEEEEAAAETDDEASAFVPLHQLRFVLPEGVQPGRASGQQQQPSQPATQAPPTGGAPPQGGMPPQQPTGGQPPAQQGGPGQQPTQQDPRRR